MMEYPPSNVRKSDNLLTSFNTTCGLFHCTFYSVILGSVDSCATTQLLSLRTRIKINLCRTFITMRLYSSKNPRSTLSDTQKLKFSDVGTRNKFNLLFHPTFSNVVLFLMINDTKFLIVLI